MSSVLVALSAGFVLIGLLGYSDYRRYAPEQLARAPRLSKAFLAAAVLNVLAGIGLTVAAIAGRLSSGHLIGALWVFLLPTIAIEWQLRRAMGVEPRSSLDRFG